MRHSLPFILVLAACDTFPGPSFIAKPTGPVAVSCLTAALEDAPGVNVREVQTNVSEGFGIIPWGPSSTKSTIIDIAFEGEDFILQLTETNGVAERVTVPGFGWGECPPPRYLRAHARLAALVGDDLNACVLGTGFVLEDSRCEGAG